MATPKIENITIDMTDKTIVFNTSTHFVQWIKVDKNGVMTKQSQSFLKQQEEVYKDLYKMILSLPDLKKIKYIEIKGADVCIKKDFLELNFSFFNKDDFSVECDSYLQNDFIEEMQVIAKSTIKEIDLFCANNMQQLKN
ncbi:MAG: hypothetical protein KAG26_03850 [Methylococcales bacterium]|nr:hypothetical protein [Methylococcales bacterium]